MQNEILEISSRKVKNGRSIALKKLLFTYAFIIVNIILFAITININSGQENFINKLTIIALTQLIVNILFLKNFNHRLFSLPILFLIFSFIFHFGQLILITLNVDLDRSYYVANRVANDVFIKSCLFVLFAQFFLVLGIMLSSRGESKQKQVTEGEDKREKEFVYKAGMILFIISIIPKVYIDFQKIILYMNGNYLSTYEIGVSGILITIANMAEIAIIMILIGKQDNKKLSKTIFILTMLYEVIIMLSGNRGRPIVFILALVYIYFNLIQKVRFRSLIVWGSVGYIGIVFINFISEIRMAQISDTSVLMEIFRKNLTNSPIFQMLGEFGGTMITLCYSVTFFLPKFGVSHGSNYLVSLLTVVPNFGGVLEGFQNQFTYVNNFPQSYTFALGGSYLGELYYAFGMYGILAAVFVGILIGKVSKKIMEAINNKKWLELSIYMILFPSFLWWVRNYFSAMVREFAWTSILIVILYSIVKQVKIKALGESSDSIRNVQGEIPREM